MAVTRHTNPNARRLRRDATDAEQRFWLEVRDRRLGGFKFRRQASIGPYMVDFLCVEALVIVEIDGGQHGGGGDQERTQWLERDGYRVLHFWNSDVLVNMEGVLAGLLAVLRRPPSPNPLPPAGEG